MDSLSIAQMATGTTLPAGFSKGGMLVYNSGDTKNDLFNFNANAGKNAPGIVLKGSDDTSAYKGILFFEDRTAGAHIGTGPSPGHTIQGGGTLSLTGTLYVTNTVATMKSAATHYQNLSLVGNSGSTTTIIGEIIADTLSLSGTSGIKMNLNPNPTLHIRQVALVR